MDNSNQPALIKRLSFTTDDGIGKRARIGHDAYLERKAANKGPFLCSVKLRDPGPLLHHNEPVLRDGKVVGYVTAGARGNLCPTKSQDDVVGNWIRRSRVKLTKPIPILVTIHAIVRSVRLFRSEMSIDIRTLVDDTDDLNAGFPDCVKHHVSALREASVAWFYVIPLSA